MLRTKSLILIVISAALWLGCQSGRSPASSPWEVTAGEDQSPLESFLEKPVEPAEFSGARAWSHLSRLEEIGPRVPGTAGSRKTRAYLRKELESIGIEVQETRVSLDPGDGNEAIAGVHVTAVIPGASQQVLLLVAPYDTGDAAGTSTRGVHESASGFATLLELARALHFRRSSHFTIWLTWVDGDSLGQTGQASALQLAGSRSLVADLIQREEFSRIRFALFLGSVGDSDLEVARDLRSKSMLREIFWRTAAELGHASTFPQDQAYGTPVTGQAAFLDARLSAVVALAGSHAVAFEGTEQARHDPDGPSPYSLEIVGRVALAGLERVAQRMQNVDDFDSSPLSVGLMPQLPADQP